MIAKQYRRVPISKVVIGENEIEEVARILRSGNLRDGPECRAFEVEFAAFTGAQIALTSSSGTSALHMAYDALLQPGDEVLVPSFTFFATASMVLAVGAVPVFCDIDPDTLTIDVVDAARRITSRTRAIAPVHLFGNPVDVYAVRDLAGAHGLKVIWDAAQAHASEFAGKDVGSLDDAVCYSFYPSKNMTTGEGGMVCTNSEELATAMRLVRSQGQSRKYHHTVLGYNFRLTDFQAAIGRAQLRNLASWTSQRRENAAFLKDRLADNRLRVQMEQPSGRNSYHQFSIILSEGIDRDSVMTSLRESGIECAVHYPKPLHQQPLFSQSPTVVTLPVSELTARQILSLPVHPFLSQEDLEYVANHVIAALDMA